MNKYISSSEEIPNEAIERLVNLKEDLSEYVSKSVGNALRDISKEFPVKFTILVERQS